MNNLLRSGIKRKYFILGIISISAIVFGLSYFIAMNTDLRLANIIVPSSGILATILVRLREVNIKSKYRWRTWYMAGMSILLAYAVSVIYIYSTGSHSYAYKESQICLGYYFMYLLLSLPVLISCAFQKQKL